MPTGTVKWFNSKKNYGVIEVDEGGERFVHTRDLKTSGSLQKGRRVQFEDKPDGKHVRNVRVIEELSTEVPAVEAQETENVHSGNVPEEVPVLTGTVTRFDQYGHGVIVQDGDGPNVYVYYKDLSIDFLEVGQRVKFTVVNGSKGPQAKNVHVIEELSTEVPAVEAPQKESKVHRVARFAKKQVRQSNASPLQLGYSYSGIVKSFNKAFGFIAVDGMNQDIFVHYTGIAGDGYRTLEAGQRVTFEVSQGRKGLQATNVQLGSVIVCSSNSN